MIHVFYRHYMINEIEKWRPKWFDYKKSFQNLLSTIKHKDKVKITVVYDGKKNNDDFIFDFDFDIFFVDAKSDYESFRQTIDLVKNSDIHECDLIYLLENDYLHTLSWDQKVLDFFKVTDNCYLSLYDHNDKYSEYYSNLESKILVTKSSHFRTTPSTCGSFITTKKVLIEDYLVHYDSPKITRTFTDLPVDHAKFLLLKKLKNRDVYSPIPGVSTHCINGLLSPIIKWEKIINE